MSSEMSSEVEYVAGSQVVLLHYEELTSKTTSDKLKKSLEIAYGPLGLGLLVVKGIPDLVSKRSDLLPLARTFAKLDDSVKAQYEHPLSHYNFGWSHGKEVLTGNLPDFAKGSFYANPIYDDPFHESPEMIQKYPSFCAPNIWPKEHLPQLEFAFKALGRLVVDTAILLSEHVDNYIVSKNPEYTPKLARIIRESRNPKARLLHYFPQNNANPVVEDKTKPAETPDPDAMGNWCGWHNDHGSLTGLTSALYIDDASGRIVENPDPSSGLYIRSRTGEVIKAPIPADCLAFQMGETQQIHSGGLVQATPHCVVNTNKHGYSNNISRETFAIFMEPEIPELMDIPRNTDIADAANGSANRFLPKGVPPLAQRWAHNGQTFGEFTNSTLAAYHPDNDKGVGNM